MGVLNFVADAAGDDHGQRSRRRQRAESID
jgi:hypothetical protein